MGVRKEAENKKKKKKSKAKYNSYGLMAHCGVVYVYVLENLEKKSTFKKLQKRIITTISMTTRDINAFYTSGYRSSNT